MRSAEQRRTWWKAHAKIKREAGLCPVTGCKNPPTPPYKMCDSHLTYARDWRRAKSAERNSQGLCRHINCTEPLATKTVCKKHADKVNIESNARQKELRAKVIAGYGAKCWACYTKDDVVLTLDHRYADGAIERANTGRSIYLKAMKEGFPEKYRLLCWNCQHLAKLGYIYEHEPGA